MKFQLSASSLVLGLAAGALVAGGLSYAAANTGGTTINACQSKSTGALRVLTSGVCKSTEVAISWNTQGQTGPQGESGSQGIRGPEGPQGVAGQDGRGADRCELAGMDWYNCDFSGRNFSYAPIQRARFQGADLTNASLYRAQAEMASLRGAKLNGADLRQAYFNAVVVWAMDPYIEQLSHDNADFRGANLAGAVFTWTSLRNANFAGADLTGTDLGRADLRGANFEGAIMRNTKFAANYFGYRGSWIGPDVNYEFLCGLVGTPAVLPEGWIMSNSCLVKQ